MQYVPSPLLKGCRNEAAVTLPGEPLCAHERRASLVCDFFQPAYPCVICVGLRVGLIAALSKSTELVPQIDVINSNFTQNLGQILSYNVFEPAPL